MLHKFSFAIGPRHDQLYVQLVLGTHELTHSELYLPRRYEKNFPFVANIGLSLSHSSGGDNDDV